MSDICAAIHSPEMARRYRSLDEPSQFGVNRLAFMQQRRIRSGKCSSLVITRALTCRITVVCRLITSIVEPKADTHAWLIQAGGMMPPSRPVERTSIAVP
jgi:hypothetical protein